MVDHIIRNFLSRGLIFNLTTPILSTEEPTSTQHTTTAALFSPWAGWLTLVYFVILTLVTHLAPLAGPRRMMATLLGLSLQTIPSLLWISGFNPRGIMELGLASLPTYVRHYTYTVTSRLSTLSFRVRIPVKYAIPAQDQVAYLSGRLL